MLFPAGFTCGGTKPAIEKLCELANEGSKTGHNPEEVCGKLQ